jgi:hypothetical protein
MCRKAIITDASWNPLGLEKQKVTEGAFATFSVQLPALPLPVTAATKDVWLNTQSSKENITHVQPEIRRVAWKAVMFPDWFMTSERWTGISKLANGMTVYESREVFYGVGAVLLEWIYAEALQKSFEAQGLGLKMLLEKQEP